MEPQHKNFIRNQLNPLIGKYVNLYLRDGSTIPAVELKKIEGNNLFYTAKGKKQSIPISQIDHAYTIMRFGCHEGID